MNRLPENDPAAYQELLNEVKQEISKTRNKLKKQKEGCYWQIGRQIEKHLQNHQGESGYSKRLYSRMTHDLKVDERTLHKISETYRSYPKPIEYTKLKIDIKV